MGLLPMPSAHAPSVFDFSDLPAYLRVWFAWWKTQGRGHSHRKLAGLIGSSDPSILVNAMEGRRSLSPPRVEALLATVLADLEPLEARYFRALSELDRARPEERGPVLEQMALLRAENAAHLLARDRVEVLARWWNYAVASLAEGRHGVSLDDPAAVASALYDRISPEQAAQAVQTLVNVGILVRTESGYRAEQPTFTTPAEVARSATRQYHTDTIGLALATLDAVSSVDRPERRQSRFLGATAALSEEALELVQAELFDFQQRVLAIAARDAHGEGPHRVFQLNLHLFPLSRAPDEPPRED
jgi:uncharacterized protein (TIGR02147 family)